MRRIAVITIAEIKDGRNWRVVPRQPVDKDFDLTNLFVEDCSAFHEDEDIVYSALMVSEGNVAKPLLLIKTVGDFDFG